jgi:phospholipid-binding lipoprotein MlaA
MNFPPAALLRTVAICCLGFVIAGCATAGEPRSVDPLETFNRQAYAFNSAVDRGVLKPTAKAYDAYAPQWFRRGVSNFFTNLGYPTTILNQLLQGKFLEAGQDTLRFALNSTLGLAGLLDPASDANLPHHDEDLGQTLGRWGVPPGPYLTVPLLGPASLRDIPSRVADQYLTPFYWYNYGNERWVSLALDLVDTRARLLPLDAALDRAFDRYAFIRDAYLQRREYQVYDGSPPEQPLEDPLEEFPDEPAQDEGGTGKPEAPAEPEAPPAPDARSEAEATAEPDAPPR